MTVDWRHLPSLVTLRAFQATAQHGGFTGAGRALNVTHAAIAQQVRALERELGLPLVQRLGRAVSLTPQGERLAQTLSDGFATLARGIADLQQAERKRGLRVATSVFIGQTVILPRLPEFWALHPGIEVKMTPVGPGYDLRADGFDLAIVGFENPKTDVEILPFARTRWVLAGAPALVGDGAVDVSKMPWLCSDPFEMQLLERAGIGLDPTRRVEIGTPHLEIAAAVLGLGLTFSVELIIRDELAKGQLRVLPVDGLPKAQYNMVLPSGPRRAATTAFVNWVKTLV